MDRLHLSSTSLSLSAQDKHVLRSEPEVITSELTSLSKLLRTNNYVSAAQRIKLQTAIFLVKTLGVFSIENDQLESVSKDLSTPANKHLKKATRDTILPWLEELLRHLEHRDVDEDVAKLLDEKLKFTEFDGLFEKDGTINKPLRQRLEEVGVWRLSPRVDEQVIHAWGDVPGEVFRDAVGPLAVFFEYTEAVPPSREERDDSCVHTGCEIPPIDYDYRFGLSPKARDALDKFNSSDHGLSRGAAGIFVRKGTHHYLVTAAHVLFPELTKMPLHSEELKDFNENVTFAVYDKLNDICIVPFSSQRQHTNGIRIAPSQTWMYKPNLESLVVKIGPRSGLTLGHLEGTNESLEQYDGLIRVSPRADNFGQRGDSGSIYFVEIKEGFVPIAVHRTSDGGCGLGSNFYSGFSKVLAKAKLGDIDEFEACMSDSLRGCSMSHVRKGV